MKGKYSIVVENAAVSFKFELDHNISIVRGNSGTGKTRLVEMVRQYEREGSEGSGVTVTCSNDGICHVLEERMWESDLKSLHHNIVFIDEGRNYIGSKKFAKAIKHSDNYFCIFMRDALPELPYSVDAIYAIHNIGKYGKLKRTYNRFSRLYTADMHVSIELDDIQVLLSEDSKAGFQFWKHLSEEDGIRCITASGKSKVIDSLRKMRERTPDDAALVIADGAAFGPEMENIFSYMKEHPADVFLYLPESFEWILLKAEYGHQKEMTAILDAPYDYIDSTEYESWEQYFTSLLVRKTDGTVGQYNKKKLNAFYLGKDQVRRIRKVLKEDNIDL